MDEDSAQPYVCTQADRYFQARELRPWVLGRLQTLWAVRGSTWKLSEASSFTPAQKQAASRRAHQPVVPVRRKTRSWTSFCFLFTWSHMMLLERLSFCCYRKLQSPAAGKRRGIDCKLCPTRDLASLCSEGIGSGLGEGVDRVAWFPASLARKQQCWETALRTSAKDPESVALTQLSLCSAAIGALGDMCGDASSGAAIQPLTPRVRVSGASVQLPGEVPAHC